MIIKIIGSLIFLLIGVYVYIDTEKDSYRKELEDLDIKNTKDEYQQMLKELKRAMPKFFK